MTLPDGTPPPPQPAHNYGDWFPFKDRVAFELAELLYAKEQMSGSKIDTLLDLWTASSLSRGQEPPFRNHVELYQTIDSIPLGDICWESFELDYGGAFPERDVPKWMTDVHIVHYRDPQAVIRQMLANPDFKDDIDFAPSREFDERQQRQLKDLMKADWAWRQAVCS